MSEPMISSSEMDALKARGRRNLAIAGALLLFVVLVFAVTILRLSDASHRQGEAVRAANAAARQAEKAAPIRPPVMRP